MEKILFAHSNAINFPKPKERKFKKIVRITRTIFKAPRRALQRIYKK